MFNPMNWHYLTIKRKIRYGIIILTMMVLSLPAQSQKVFINEINYRSVEIQQDIDFIEIYNAEPTLINLSGWSLTEGIAYEFPAGTTIPTGGFLVICADPATCQSVLNFSGAIGPYNGGLSARGDEVILRNSFFQEIDRVDYESWKEWPNVRYDDYEVPVHDASTGLDGTDKVKVPVSIQKMHPELPGQHGGSWRGHAPTPGSTNAYYNSDWTNIGVIKSVSKSPDHPVSGEDVRIKAEMRNLDLLSSSVNLELQYQIVEPGSYIHKSDSDYANNWISIPMLDNGVGADSTANNGTYTAAIPASVQQHRRLIRYRIMMSSPAYTAIYPDQNHNESNYAYYVYDGYPIINGFDINAVNPIQDVTIITADTTAFQYIGPGNGVDNTGQYTGYDYLGEGTLVYNGKVYDHVVFRPRGRTNGRAARVKPGVKFNLNSERKIAPDDDCGDEYEEEQGALTLSGTYVNDITTHGATESMIHKILNLTGAMGRHVDYTQFRVVDEANENGNTGDFWGVFLILENYDGDYFKEHDLPDGNIWRHKRSGAFPHRMTHQGDFPNTNNIGDWSSHHPQYAGFVDRYLNHNLTSSYAHKQRFINDKIANNFFANGANNYEGKHAQREYYDAETGKWVVWYGDYDTTFGMTYDDGTLFERSSSSPDISIELVQDMSGIWRDYQNEMRSVYDLLFSQEQADFLVDMESRTVYDPAAAYDWTDLDHSRWNQFYDLGDVDAHIAWYKTWFQERGDFLAQDTIGGFYDPEIPDTPTISLTGSGALDDMTFNNSSFSDPQGASTFSALEWRVGEWSDPSNPYYATVCEPIYEIETVWRSGEITTFSNTFTIPAEAYLKTDRTYKIRVRYKDNTGRWSHWSSPEEVIPTPATQIAPNIVINEIMYNPIRTCGNEFIEIINAESYPVDMTGFAFMEGIAYQFPKNKIMQPGEILVLAQDSVLFEQKYGFSPYGDYSSSLSNDGERLELSGPYNVIADSLAYDDKEPWDEAPDGTGPSLELLDTSSDNADPISWFRSKDDCGTPGQPNSRQCSGTPIPIVINEINYNSANSNEAGDWVELHNTTSSAVDLSNWRFYDGTNEYLLPVGTIMLPEDFLVLVQNDTLFSATFPHLTDNVDYIGNFLFSLSGGGERVTLFDDNDCMTDYVVYDDDLPWDTIPDGNGPTLSLIDPSFDNMNHNSWENSSEINSAYGTPGRANEPCPEVEIVLPNVVCATIPFILETDTIYAGLNMTWFVQGVGLTPGDFVEVTWNTPGNYNVQLITDYFECRKVYNTIVTVEDCNLVPEPIDDEFNTDEDTPLTANVLTNDSDPDPQDNLTVTTTPVTPPTNGTLILNADGSFTYTPNPDYNGPDSFEYEVCDDGDPILCETALVTIEVIPLNDAPVAIDDTETTQEDTDLTSDVLTNDWDIENGILTADVVSNPANGTLVLNPDGNYTYTPNPDFNGSDSFEYSICDDGNMIVSTFSGQVAAGEDDVEERANNGVIDTSSSDLDITEDLPVIYSAVGIRITDITVPQGATVTSAYLEFVADESQSVTTSWTIGAENIGNALTIPTTAYSLSSKPRTSATATWANIPAWTTDNIYQSTDISLVVQEIIDRGDWSTGNAITFIIEGAGTRTAESFEGTAAPKLIINYQTLSPNPTDISLCDTALVNITIEPVNDVPIAVDDSYTTPEDTQLSDNIALNDSDVDHPIVVTTTQVTPPANGIAFLSADGTFTYMPNPDFNGIDSFEYEICDGGTPALCDTAIVTIDVGGVNDAPIAADDTETTQEDTDLVSNVLPNDFDVDGDNLSVNITPITLPQNGSVTLLANGSYAYTPNADYNGTDSFEYEICDGGTPELCDRAIVNITIESVNDAPIAVDDLYSTSEDTPISDDVSVNDNDVDHPVVVTTTPVTPPANGTLVLNVDGTFSYTPNTDYNGTDSFEYEICDGGTPDLCDIASVQISISAENDAPIIAQNLSDAIPEDTSLSDSVMSNATDVDGDNLSASLINGPTNGTLSLNANGTYNYVPNPNFNGTDTFEYEICDDGTPILCTNAEMTINVSPVNDMPIAVIDTIYTFSNTSVQDNILLNDWDIDGDNLSSSIVPGATPTNGTITVSPDGNIDYMPNTDYIGTDYYEYEVCDDGNPSLCNTASVTIIIDAGCVEVNLKVLLEGPYDPTTGDMVTTLNNDRRLLPGQTPIAQLFTPTPAGQPYNTAPWNYAGTEGLGWTDADYDSDVVDWVLVSFRTGITKADQIGMAAGIVRKDGTIEFERCPLTFSSNLNSLYVVIEHRNHMGVMSADKVPVLGSTLTYDFTTEDGYRDPTSFGQKELPSGAWAMYAGDIDQSDMPSYDITGLDKTVWFQNNGLFGIYFPADLNFDGDVNGADKALWLVNNGISSRVPK